MKKIVLFTCLTLSLTVNAAKRSTASSTSENIFLGYRYTNIMYAEPGLMKEYGSEHGIAFSGEWALSSDFFSRVEADYVSGGLTYDGQYQNGTPVTSTTTDSLINLRALFAPNTLFTAANINFRSLFGIGYRQLYDRINGSGGYRRLITYYYLPIGFEAVFPFGGKDMGTLSLEYDILLQGTVQSYLTDVSPVLYRDITNKQSTGRGAHVSFAYDFEVAGAYLRVKPYYEYWDVDRSDIYIVGNTGYLEPYNYCIIYGLDLGFKF